MKFVKYLAAFSLAIMLTACSDEPSDSDIRQAMENTAEEFKAKISGNQNMPEEMRKQMAEQMKFEIHSLTNYGCKKSTSQEGVYDCDVEMDITLPMIGRSKKRDTASLKKEDGQWKMVRTNA